MTGNHATYKVELGVVYDIVSPSNYRNPVIDDSPFQSCGLICEAARHCFQCGLPQASKGPERVPNCEIDQYQQC